jgi:signal transduction histidine kinase
VPTGLAWRLGIRPGQVVVDQRAADDPGGWRLETTDGSRTFLVDEATANQDLLQELPLAVAAVIAGAAALLLLRARRSWVLPASCLAFVLAAMPLVEGGNAGLAEVELAVAAIVPAGWTIGRLPGGRLKDVVLGLGLLAFTLGWVYAREAPLAAADGLEWARQNLSTWGTGLVVLDRVVAIRTGNPVPLIRPRPFDVAALGLVSGGALALVYLAALPPVFIAVVAAIAVLAIPTLRRRLRPVEDALLADVRAQAAAEASEEERGKLARELHDVPLQELFGVIRRLEVKPGTEAESDDLRALASHLRNVAINLRPPVLDDLGLPAALEFLAEGARSDDRRVVAEIRDGTGLAREERPPEPVELALFRIAAEAVTNAVAHSGATEIRMTASVEPARVDLRISDNGGGLNPEAARAALRQKHMGLNSMRRRAEAIDADFRIQATRQGTTIETVWQG